MPRLDIIVYGATGYTAGFILREIAGHSSLPEGFTWGIGGRNETALKRLQSLLSPRPEIFVADVVEEGKLIDMARTARVVLSCVGPFRLYGEPVVRACIEAGSHYLDISGEPEFIENMHLKYHNKAQQKRVVRIHNNSTLMYSKGYDSVPCDMGVLQTKRLLQDLDTVPSSVEMFFGVQTTGKYGVHYTTYLSAIHGFAYGHAQIAKIRQELAPIRPKPIPLGPPPALPRTTWWGGAYDDRVRGWLFPYFVAGEVFYPEVNIL
ncbi:hypothetical protein VKT23_008440 [Stygiomarasmius scandens]|uniref:Saccharopine dehydrogenase NADP binding domain-containing protein n=1 Tax=Marasmiellus scandens TaxID=2682957 RepID=A0ABR1JIR5_9AGAR